MQMNTSDLTGEALNWAIAMALGLTEKEISLGPVGVTKRIVVDEYNECFDMQTGKHFSPQSDFSQGGALICNIEGLVLKNWLESSPSTKSEAHIHNYAGNWVAFGETTLIAVCRVFVMSMIGATVEIPNEIIKS